MPTVRGDKRRPSRAETKQTSMKLVNRVLASDVRINIGDIDMRYVGPAFPVQAQVRRATPQMRWRDEGMSAVRRLDATLVTWDGSTNHRGWVAMLIKRMIVHQPSVDETNEFDLSLAVRASVAGRVAPPFGRKFLPTISGVAQLGILHWFYSNDESEDPYTAKTGGGSLAVISQMIDDVFWFRNGKDARRRYYALQDESVDYMNKVLQPDYERERSNEW